MKPLNPHCVPATEAEEAIINKVADMLEGVSDAIVSEYGKANLAGTDRPIVTVTIKDWAVSSVGHCSFDDLEESKDPLFRFSYADLRPSEFGCMFWFEGEPGNRGFAPIAIVDGVGQS